jgi:hypothetical protein
MVYYSFELKSNKISIIAGSAINEILYNHSYTPLLFDRHTRIILKLLGNLLFRRISAFVMGSYTYQYQ